MERDNDLFNMFYPLIIGGPCRDEDGLTEAKSSGGQCLTPDVTFQGGRRVSGSGIP